MSPVHGLNQALTPGSANGNQQKLSRRQGATRNAAGRLAHLDWATQERHGG